MPWAGIAAAGKKIGRSKINCSGMAEATGFEPTDLLVPNRVAARQKAHALSYREARCSNACRSFSRTSAAHPFGNPRKFSVLGSGRKRSEAQPAAQQKSRRQTWRQPFWSRRRDLNPRPLGPEPSALPSALRLVDLPVNYSIFWCRRQPFCLALFHKIIFGTAFTAFYRRRAVEVTRFYAGRGGKSDAPAFYLAKQSKYTCHKAAGML